MKYLIANHKSLMKYDEIKEFRNNYKNINNDKLKTIIIPSDLYINLFDENIGIQNITHLENTPHTGEIDVSLLNDLNIEYSLVGHSERREYSNETNDIVNEKLKVLTNNNITPILCIGESLEEYNNNLKEQILLEQLNSVKYMKDEIIIAYEPVWAIGTGLVPTNDEIYETIKYIKETVNNLYNTTPKVLYGGSVNENNINNLEKINNVDGYLVGGASTKYESFNKLVNEILGDNK